MGCSQGKSVAIQNGSTPENKPADKQNGVQQTAASTNDDNSANVSEADLKYYFLHSELITTLIPMIFKPM